MILKIHQTFSPVMRPRVTPDPDRAADLQRRMNALSYRPENGFHRDRWQARRAPFMPGLAAQR